MSSPNIEIHEFSTGIHFQERANSWVSLGFTGQYMNATINPIPTVVERSIANQEFALTEGSSTEKPAIIGRVVGSGDDIWSVMAVVTRGQDEVGRSAAFYRYFLCKGNHENLWRIIAWWESKNSPTFNPLDTKTVGQPNKLLEENVRTWNDSDPEWRKLSSDTSPLLKPREHEEIFRKSYILLNQINALAIDKSDKSNKNSLPIAWAFNVEALEKPERFQVIQPASPKAYEGLKRAIANAAQVVSSINVDEAALKSAIRSLMNSSTIKPEAVEEIVKGLENKNVTPEYWESLFNAQGADKAIKQKIYSPQMVRLITLRAMVIPKTLPEFLEWLNIQGGKKPDENQTVSLDFQSKISVYLKEQIIYRIEFLLIELLQEQITPERLAWLFQLEGSIWNAAYKDFVTFVKDDLNVIAKACNSPESQKQEYLNLLKLNDQIWNILITHWLAIKKNRNHILTWYNPLAQLFEFTEDYHLSAFFHQISSGSVPKNVFSEIKGTSNSSLSPIYKSLGLKLIRHKSKLEKFADNNFVPIATGIILAFFVGVSITLLLWFKNSKNVKNVPDMTLSQQGIALQKFRKTTTFIQMMVNDLKNNYNEQEIDLAMSQILDNSLLDYQDIVKYHKKQPKPSDAIDANIPPQWVKAIYKYQYKKYKNDKDKKNDNSITGIIDTSPQDPTFDDLKQDIKAYLAQKQKTEKKMK
jgi:hypothetical protein